MFPKSYNLVLDLRSDTVIGKVIIPVKVIEATETITIHSSGLLLSRLRVENENEGEPIVFRGYEESLINEMVIITLGEKLIISSTYILTIDFQRLTKKTLQYGSARTAFPCFDEPDIKVPFKLTLIIPSGHTALSTMDLAFTEMDDDKLTSLFNVSPLMSAQANFVVTPKLASSVILKPLNGKEMIFSIYTIPEEKSNISYALNFGSKVIENISEILKTEFPLSKLDFIGESDLPFKAVGSFGLTTFKEHILVHSKQNSSTADRLATASCISYEIIKTWFSGLVTSKWWSDLWLELGLINFLKYKVLIDLQSNFHQFEGLSDVYELDATLISCPIVHNIGHVGEISLTFENVAARKGAAVLRIVEHMVGFEKLREVFTRILQRFAYSSWRTEDLINEIDSLKLDQNIPSVIRTWTQQAGYPVIEFEKAGDQKFNLTQKRFLICPYDDDNVGNSEFG